MKTHHYIINDLEILPEQNNTNNETITIADKSTLVFIAKPKNTRPKSGIELNNNNNSIARTATIDAIT